MATYVPTQIEPTVPVIFRQLDEAELREILRKVWVQGYNSAGHRVRTGVALRVRALVVPMIDVDMDPERRVAQLALNSYLLHRERQINVRWPMECAPDLKKAKTEFAAVGFQRIFAFPWDGGVAFGLVFWYELRDLRAACDDLDRALKQLPHEFERRNVLKYINQELQSCADVLIALRKHHAEAVDVIKNTSDQSVAARAGKELCEHANEARQRYTGPIATYAQRIVGIFWFPPGRVVDLETWRQRATQSTPLLSAPH